jgi:hypothetical protein
LVPARLAACLAVVAALLLALPAAALAIDPVTIAGTVVREGAPVTGVQVLVSVVGGDQIATTTTDEDGAFAVPVEATAGAQVRIDVTGQTSRSEPDAQGCVRIETPSGSLTFSLETLEPAPVEVAMDDVLTGTVCAPTSAPHITPPSTDAVPVRAGQASAGGLLVVLGAIAVFAGLAMAAGPRTRARRWKTRRP